MNITPTVPAREDVLLILCFCLVFGSVNVVNARPSSNSFQPETSVDMVVTHNSEPSKTNESGSANVSKTHVYSEGISGFAGTVSLEHLGETLSDPQIDHAILDYFMEPSGLSTADESSNNRKKNGAGIPPSEVPGYLQAINASNLNPKDVPLNDVHVGVIDLISNPDHPVIKNASNIHHVPSRSKAEAEAVSSTLSSYEDNHIDHGTRSAGIIGGEKKTGIAPGIHLHLFSTAHAAVQDIQNADEPRNESIEEVTENANARVSTVLHGLEYYSRQISRNTPIDVLLLNLAIEDASHRKILQESIRNLNEKGVMIITPAGNEGEAINDGFLAKDTIPAVFPETTTVTARTLNDGTYNQIADWSNYGKKTADLSAPGESFGTVTYNGTNKNESDEAKGTSYAAAVVTGASAYLIGLAKKHDLPLSNEALTTLLKRTGTRSQLQNSNHDSRNKPAVNLEKAAQFLSSYGNEVQNPTLNSFIAQLFFGPHPTSDKTVHVFGIGGIGAGQEFVGKTFFKKELQPSFNVKFHGHSYSEDKQIAYQIRELGNHTQRPDCNVCPENNNQPKNAVLVGHSWGARKGAMQVADQLEQTSFRSMVTLDPVHATMDTPASDFTFNNMDYWLNIYQEKPVADQIPQIPFIGHMIRGILGLPRLIDGDQHFMASFGGRTGHLNSADQNRTCTDCTHTETKKMLDQWLQSQKTLLPSFRSSPQ